MAADDETCHGNANFAIICSFISKFGEEFGLPNSIPALQRMLEDTENVDDELKEIHIKLLRKARKWFNKEKWERALVKFCHEYSSVDAWEIERFGYKKAKLSVKLELLKRLLELQFDCNAKFKGEVNKLDASSLRVLPVGRDLNGHMYWYQLDKECNLRLYVQEVDDEMSWKLLCSTKQDLETLLESLGSKIERKEEAAEVDENKGDSKDTKEGIDEEIKTVVKSETEIKSEATEEKSEECKVLESTAMETVTIKQEVEEKPETSNFGDKECSVVKQDNADHQSVNSTDVPQVVTSDTSGGKIPPKDCTISLQPDNTNLGETNNQSYVIKTVTSDGSESKANNSSPGDKEENVDKPPDKVHLLVSEMQGKSEKGACRSVEPNNAKSIEKIVTSLAEHSEAPGHLCESKKEDAAIEKSANAKQSDSELRKLAHEGPVEERLSPRVKTSFAESIMGKHLPENLPFPRNVTVKDAHLTKVNSAMTASLLGENVNALLDRRSIMDNKKQSEHRVMYKSPPPIRSVSVCDEVPMDLSTTGRSRESKSEPFIIPRPEHEVPGNYKTESFITKIERQLTKMCEDNESAKFHRNDRFSFTSKHHKLRRNESYRKLHAKSIDQLQLSKMNIDKQNLGNQTNVSVIIGEKFLTKESVEQPRQSVICEIKNSKLISNEKIHEHSDSSNHLTSSGIANSHCVSSITQKSGLQPIEKGPEQQDKGVIQIISSVSPPDKTCFLSPRGESFNNAAISERKNLGFRKCLLNEFKADKSSLRLESPSSQMLVKDKFGETRSVSKLEDARQLHVPEDAVPLNRLEDARSQSIMEGSKLLSEKMRDDPKLFKKIGEQSRPPKKCVDSELMVRKYTSEERKPVSVSLEKSEITKPISRVGEKQVGKDLLEGTKSSCQDAKLLGKEINCKQLGAAGKEDTCGKEHSRKEQKCESELLQKKEKTVTEFSQKEEKCVIESSQKEVCVTESSQKEEKCVTEPSQKDGKYVAGESSQEKGKCVAETSQKELKCMTKPSQKEEKCVVEPSQKEEKCMIEPSRKEEKHVMEFSQEKEKCVIELSEKEGKCVTECSEKEGKHVIERSEKEEKCATECPEKEEKCATECPEKEEKCVTERPEKEEKCVTEQRSEKKECVTECSEKRGRCMTEYSEKEEKCMSETSKEEGKGATEPSRKEGKCVTKPSQAEEKHMTEHLTKKEKSKELTNTSPKNGSNSGLKSPDIEECCNLLRLSGENDSKENKGITKGDKNDVKKLNGKDICDVTAGSEQDKHDVSAETKQDECDVNAESKQDKCDGSTSSKKDSSKKNKCEVNTVHKKGQSKKNKCDAGTSRKKGELKQSGSLRNNCKEKDTVSGKHTDEQVAVDSPLQGDKTPEASLADSSNNLERKKDSVGEDEHQKGKKGIETCESSKRVRTDKAVIEDTQVISLECETEQERSVCNSDVSKDSQNVCETKHSTPVESDINAKKHSSVKNAEPCTEIPKLDQEVDVELSKNANSDWKSNDTPEEESSHLREKELDKSDTVTMQTSDESLKIDVNNQASEIDPKEGVLAHESINGTNETKCKDLENENSERKVDETVDNKNGDPLKKDHETSKSDKADGSASLEKCETVELLQKEVQNEERAQVKSKLRRSSRTSRGCSEATKNETENSGLCRSEVEKNKIQVDGQKPEEMAVYSSSQKCPDVCTNVREKETNGKDSEVAALNEKDLNDKKCEADIENIQGNENKRRKSERRSSKSSSRRSRNSRKPARNVPKASIACETGITPPKGDKLIPTSDVTGGDSALHFSVSSEKLDGLKIKFSPPKKNIEFTKDVMCDIGISSVCLESKIKSRSFIKIVNNKHFKSKIKESFSKKAIGKLGSEDNPICIDQEESFTVGRMRTRGRLKRECSAVAPPPPKEPVLKNKPVAPSSNKTPQSSQNKATAKNKAQQPRVGTSSAATPRKRVRGKRSSPSKTPIPDSILEIIGSSEEKSVSKNDKMKKVNEKKSIEIVSAAFPVAENSESDSLPVKRSRRIQEQNQKKISQLAVEMEQEQRRLEKLAKQNAAVAKSKQKEAAEKTPKPTPLPQPQARVSKKSNKSEAKQPDLALADFKNSPRKTRTRSRNLTKMTLMYEDDSKDAEYETSRDTVKSRRRRNGRRGRKKKYKPWDLSSESSSPSEELTEEEEEEEQEELLVFNTNEDEFACEEIDENAEPVIVRRARTAKKAKSASESESEADNEPAPDDKPCARCGKYDEPEWILLCDKCDSGYHTRCLAPPLMIIPDGDWYCPPCEHAFLVENLLVELHKLEQMLKQREREELRKQRLAYVGISLDNVLKPEKKEKQENESYEEEEESDESSEEDRIYSKRSSRTRRVVNYQFKEFDELIQSAIEEEMMGFRLPEKPEGTAAAAVDSNEDSEADVVAPSRRKKKAHRLNDLDFTDVEDSDEEYKGSSMSETEVSQSPQSDGSNSRHSGSSASWRGGRKTRASRQKKRHRKSRNSGDSDYLDGESFRPTTRRAAQKNISYRELSSDEEWGDDKPKKPTVKKWTKKRRQSSTSSESSDESYGRRRSKKARIVQKWKKSNSDTEPEQKKSRSSSRKWGESDSESDSKQNRKKAHGVQRWEDSESASDSGSRKVKKTRTVQKWEGSESESESDSKKSSSSDSESSGTSVQSAEKWKIKKSSEGNGIKININRKVLDSESDDSTSGQARQKKKTVSRIVDSEDSEESYDDASKKVSDEESTSESNTGQKSYKEDKAASVKNVPSNSVKDVKSGPQITITDAEKVPETVVDQGPPKVVPHRVGIHFKGNVPPSVQKVIKNVKPLGRSLMKSDSEHKNFDSSISETFSNDSQSLQGLPTEHEEPMCESDSETDPKLNRFSNDQYICKTEIFEKDSVYRPAKEDQSFNYATAEEKSYQIPYTGLSSLQDYPSRPSPLKPSMVETYSNSTSPSKLTPLDSYSEASSPKGFISLDSCSSFRKGGSSFVGTDPEAKPRPILTSENYQGEIRFPPEQYPPYERPSHLSPAMCPSSPAAFPQSPSARENASPPRMYSQYPEPYAGQRSPDYYHSQQYYGREEGVPRQNYVSNYSSSENVSPYPYNTNSSQQPNGGFMIDTLLRSRNPDGEEDELTGVTDIVSYITQE